MRGLEDPLATHQAYERECARLDALGVPFRVVEHAGGHDIHSGALRDLESALDPPATVHGK